MQFDDYKYLTLDIMKGRLEAHCNALASGFRDTKWNMFDFLHGLVNATEEAVGASSESDEFVDALVARYNLCTDIVAGEYGLSVMMDAILTLDADLYCSARSRFPDRDFGITSLVVGRTTMVHTGLYDRTLPERGALEMKAVLHHLLSKQANEADDIFMDLVAGRYGVEMQAKVASAIEVGFKDDDDTAFSTLRVILGEGRVELLKRLANLGMPEPLRVLGSGKKYTAATTETGQWLDILTNFRGLARTTFPHQVSAYRNSWFAVDLADILVKHDPHHKTIESMKGMEGYALITEAAMRARIQQMSAETGQVNESTVEAPSARRRARYV